MIREIDQYLTSLGMTTHLTYDMTGEKANLFATLPTRDACQQGGIILSGHTDVVPVDGQTWDTDPFQAVIDDERVWGRGTCDMKGFIAVVLALIPEFLATPLSQPLHLAFFIRRRGGLFWRRASDC